MSQSKEALLAWVTECPECAVAKIEILQMDLDEWKSIANYREQEMHRLENQLARGYI
jgi:FtsZ-binding cell division protein ZapB